MTLNVGDIVAAHKDILSDNEYWVELCAKAGENLVVFQHIRGGLYEVYRKALPPDTYHKFCIREDEVDLVRAVDEDRTNLVYVLHAPPWRYGGMHKAWDKVSQILKEFKKRKHTGFYFDVQELSRERGYLVKVYKDPLTNNPTRSNP